ncbi:D-methionine ABC transporter, ATP-binding protein [Streptomyces sp. SPB78]|uniref:oligopeptide/dipeptide ABC transporter ATP-binding protein n=1 Tax=Streptomyces sp. (strain SPB78) TaxID=591157 RepID=UPI0001DEDB5E|nr:oligopeptide/dipeptide ABC transporter ATP-binding protein [Streptomyces sp. SPB78]EFL02943.1 D-methionine ABC transporter, ATP-binding protein [Streptomyces sp. SPB78]
MTEPTTRGTQVPAPSQATDAGARDAMSRDDATVPDDATSRTDAESDATSRGEGDATSRDTSRPLLDVRDLRITYGSGARAVPAVRGVDLTLRAGEKLGIAGESGCGKSTLAMALLRLLPPGATLEGEILLDGEDVRTMAWGRLRAVRWAGASIVFQGAMHSLNAVHRIGDQILEPILLHRLAGPEEGRRRVKELLRHVGLPVSRATAYPHELSGGQRQRVMIAMALACDPQLIIADEPTTALDVMIQAQILRLIEGLVAEKGIGLVMISHDLAVLADTCDRLAIMYAGRVVEEGPAREVYAQAIHPYGAALSGAFPRIGDPASRFAPRGLPGDPPDPGSLPTGCTFHPRCPVALPSCATEPQPLRAAGPGRRAACVRVDEGFEEASDGATSRGGKPVPGDAMSDRATAPGDATSRDGEDVPGAATPRRGTEDDATARDDATRTANGAADDATSRTANGATSRSGDARDAASGSGDAGHDGADEARSTHA